LLNATYPINIAETKRQSTRRADRPIAAWTNCLAAMGRDEDIKITGGSGQPAQVIGQAFLQQGVPLTRAVLWAEALNGGMLELKDFRVPNITLSDYQHAALHSLSCAGHVIALDTGLGKTLTTIAALIKLAEKYPARCYICCPVNAFGAWQEYRELLEEHYAEVAIISIDSLHKVKGMDPADGGVVVFDEAHLLGTCKAARTKNAHHLRRCFDYGVCLTGTLLHGGVEKALSVLDLAVPGAAAFSSFWTAGDFFHCLVRKEVPGRGLVSSLEKPSGDSATAFYEFISRFSIMVKKASSIALQAGIPAQVCETIRLECEAKTTKEITIAWAKAHIKEHGEMPQAAAARAMLRREGIDKKIAWVINWLDRNDEPVVLFAWSKDSLARTEQALQELDIPYAYVDGAVTGPKRIEQVAKFQGGEVRVYLGQIDASCVAANLFKARISVAMELTDRSANYDQALGRTCRRGQTRECTHYNLVTNPYQLDMINTVSRGVNFDAAAAEWAVVNNVLKSVAGDNND